jgi:hypothetical protein
MGNNANPTCPTRIGLCNNNYLPKMWAAKVTYEFRADHHIFRSESIPGLFIASKDKNKAFAQLVPVIKGIILASTGQNVRVFLGAN